MSEIAAKIQKLALEHGISEEDLFEQLEIAALKSLPVPPGDTFASRLHHLRSAAGENQEQLAKAIGSSRASIGNYESANRTPSITTVSAISKHYNVSLDWLVGLSEERGR